MSFIGIVAFDRRSISLERSGHLDVQGGGTFGFTFVVFVIYTFISVIKSVSVWGLPLSSVLEDFIKITPFPVLYRFVRSDDWMTS
jgi:hypothetical protein